MIFYSYHDGEDQRWFTSKAEATKEARTYANQLGYPVDVSRRTINQKPSSALVLAILNNQGFVDKIETVTTVYPAANSRGALRVKKAMTVV
jgi:hypothetical protein